MEDARRLAAKSPLPPVSPIHLPESTAASIRNVLKDIDEISDGQEPAITPVPSVRGKTIIER